MDTKEKLEYVFIEYREIRNELRIKQERQFTMISIFISIFGVIFAQCINVIINLDAPMDHDKFIICTGFLFFLVLPSISCFFGLLWLDQVYRQFRMLKYGVYLENKINKLANVKNTANHAIVFWEHWLKTDEKTIDIKGDISKLYYCICLVLFFVLPLISVTFGLTQIGITNWLFGGIFVYICYMILSIIYIRRVLKYNKSSN